MNLSRKIVPGILLAAAMLGFQSCATLKDMASALTNLKRLQFKIGGTEDFRLAGIAIGGKSSLSQFSALDAQPRVSTPLGSITYPGRLTIVSMEFR